MVARRVQIQVLVYSSLLLVASAATSLTAVAQTDAPSMAPEPSAGASADCPELTLKLAHGDPGLPSAYELGAQFFANRVSELTDGRITVETFPNGVLGEDSDILAQVQSGSLDMGINSTYSNAIPIATVLDLPFLFADVDTWKKAMAGQPGQTVKAAAADTGMKILDLWLGGYRSVYSTNPINTMDDLKGLKLRTQQTAAFVALFEALGAIPTPMAFGEVYLGLQQGTINGAETALASMVDAKHYEVAKNAAVTNHALSTVALTMSQSRWDSLSEGCQGLIQQAADDATSFENQTVIDQGDSVIETLTELGIDITYPDTASAVEIARSQVYPKIVTEPDQQDLLDMILQTP